MLVKIPDPDDFTAEICAIYKNKSMDKRVAEDEMVDTTLQKHQFFGAQLSLPLNSHIHTWLLEKP